MHASGRCQANPFGYGSSKVVDASAITSEGTGASSAAASTSNPIITNPADVRNLFASSLNTAHPQRQTATPANRSTSLSANPIAPPEGIPIGGGGSDVLLKNSDGTASSINLSSYSANATVLAAPKATNPVVWSRKAVADAVDSHFQDVATSTPVDGSSTIGKRVADTQNSDIFLHHPEPKASDAVFAQVGLQSITASNISPTNLTEVTASNALVTPVATAQHWGGAGQPFPSGLFRGNSVEVSDSTSLDSRATAIFFA